jgi:hypothetical protein
MFRLEHEKGFLQLMFFEPSSNEKNIVAEKNLNEFPIIY